MRWIYFSLVAGLRVSDNASTPNRSRAIGVRNSWLTAELNNLLSATSD